MDISWYAECQYFLDSMEMMDIVHLIDDKSVNLTLVSKSVLTHGMNKTLHR